MAEEQVKRKRGRPKGSNAHCNPENFGNKSNNKYPDVPEGYNAQAIAYMREIKNLPKPDKKDTDALRKTYYQYLEICQKYDHKIGNLAAYAAIGVLKQEIDAWVNGKNEERRKLALEIKQDCGMYREMLAADGKVNPVTTIFWQKNFDGFRDQQEVVVAPNMQELPEYTKEDIAKRYLTQHNVIDAEKVEPLGIESGEE